MSEEKYTVEERLDKLEKLVKLIADKQVELFYKTGLLTGRMDAKDLIRPEPVAESDGEKDVGGLVGVMSSIIKEYNQAPVYPDYKFTFKLIKEFCRTIEKTKKLVPKSAVVMPEVSEDMAKEVFDHFKDRTWPHLVEFLNWFRSELAKGRWA